MLGVIDTFIGISALLLSGYVFWRTYRFGELEGKLNALLLAKVEAEAMEGKMANLSASVLSIGSGKRRVRVWNKGPAPAMNVRIECPDGNELITESDMAAKFPMESMDAHQSVELGTCLHMGSKRKHSVVLRWADDSGEEREKLVHLTL